VGSWWRFAWITICAIPALADVPAESCLRAENSFGTLSKVSAATLPSNSPLGIALENLRQVMGVTPPVSLVDSPIGGISAARPPCRQIPIYMITVDAEQLEERERQLRGASQVLVAHELGHVLQYLSSPSLVQALCTNSLNDVKTLELMADFAAGYAMYKTQKLAIDQGNTLLARTIASVADYGFADVTHHGTVTERMSAFGYGEAAALSGRRLDMAALMRNSASFTNRLAGPSLTMMAEGESYEKWVEKSLEEIYR
jgi:hypothetical protein